MTFLFGRGEKRRIPPNATFRITQEGSAKLQEFSGDVNSQILMALETRGTSNIGELCGASGLSRGQVERAIPGLIQGGYIRPIVSSDYEDAG